MPTLLKASLRILATILSVAMALYATRYLLGIGQRVPQILGNLFARPWLYVHIAGAATALLLGPFNFIATLRRRVPALHRWIGRLYVAGCLVGGIGGFIIALRSFAGPVATLGFGSLAVCWIIATAQGLRLAIARRLPEHRAWMIRSFAMTFGAVTLRLYLAVAVTAHLPFLDSYRAISFLAWIPNLIVVELLLIQQGVTLRHRTASI